MITYIFFLVLACLALLYIYNDMHEFITSNDYFKIGNLIKSTVMTKLPSNISMTNLSSIKRHLKTNRKLNKRKVFCIGFHKTGTTSMRDALKQLGYRVAGNFYLNNRNISGTVVTEAIEMAKQYDAFQDNPWPILYKELDQAYPNSQFILTIRDSLSWIKSQVNYFKNTQTRMRQWIYGDKYGCPEGNEDIYIQRYEQHNHDVLTYFQSRPADLLIMNLSAGDGWNKLCPFVKKPMKDKPFPHKNSKLTGKNSSTS